MNDVQLDGLEWFDRDRRFSNSDAVSDPGPSLCTLVKLGHYSVSTDRYTRQDGHLARKFVVADQTRIVDRRHGRAIL